MKAFTTIPKDKIVKKMESNTKKKLSIMSQEPNNKTTSGYLNVTCKKRIPESTFLSHVK